MEIGREEGDKCEEVGGADQEDEEFEAEGLLVEGEEREYVLELLMREAPLDMRANAHPAKAKPAICKGKRKRNLGKKFRKRAKVVGEAAIRRPGRDGRMDTVGDGGGQVTISTPRNPESKGGGLVGEKRGRRDQPTTSLLTSGGECSV